MENTILDSNLIKQENSGPRRRSLLPWWIKTFAWIFLVMALIVPVSIIYALLGQSFQMALYGFSTNNPLSTDGLFLAVLFILKGITALGLWTEKDWAINIAMVDAILGIIMSGFMTIVYPFMNIDTGYQLNIRLELLLLIPFLYKLIKIRPEWNKLAVANK